MSSPFSVNSRFQGQLFTVLISSFHKHFLKVRIYGTCIILCVHDVHLPCTSDLLKCTYESKKEMERAHVIELILIVIDRWWICYPLDWIWSWIHLLRKWLGKVPTFKGTWETRLFAWIISFYFLLIHCFIKKVSFHNNIDFSIWYKISALSQTFEWLHCLQLRIFRRLSLLSSTRQYFLGSNPFRKSSFADPALCPMSFVP